MAEKVILEHWNPDSYYLKLESEFESQMRANSIYSLHIVEGFGYTSPIMVIKMMDGFGDSVSKTFISPDATYNLRLGRSPEENETSSFSLSNITYETTTEAQLSQIGMDINFLSGNWHKLMKDTVSRSWANKRYSDVVAEIAKEADLVPEIEHTKELLDIIQPNWTNANFLNWLIKNSFNQKDQGGYAFAVTLDGRLIFKTLNELYSQPAGRDLVMTDTDPDGESETQTFKNFVIKQDYAPMVNRGAGGFETMYFDFETGEYVRSEKVVSELTTAQLSDWYFLSGEHEGANRMFYGGRHPHTEKCAERELLALANNVQSITIGVPGDTTIKLGEVVNLIIPNTVYKEETPLNERFSGKWLITKVAHSMVFNGNSYGTTLTLIRAGINDPQKTITTLVKSANGR